MWRWREECSKGPLAVKWWLSGSWSPLQPLRPLEHYPVWILSTVNKTMPSLAVTYTFPLQLHAGGRLLLWPCLIRVDHGQPVIMLSPQLYLQQLTSCMSLLQPREKSPSLKFCLCSPLSTFAHCALISVVWGYVPFFNFSISLTVFSLPVAASANWTFHTALHGTIFTGKTELVELHSCFFFLQQNRSNWSFRHILNFLTHRPGFNIAGGKCTIRIININNLNIKKSCFFVN